ncbi:MAG: lyase family protein [Pseudomonadota bacterium]
MVWPGPIYSSLFGDQELQALLSDDAFVSHMVAVERALARVQGKLSVIPEDAAAAIDQGLQSLNVDPARLAQATASSGVPVPGLLAVLRSHLPPDARDWLHWGATSQDIVDTANALGLSRATEVIKGRTTALCATLRDTAIAHEATLMAGRTRAQLATPTTFGLRVATWAKPLLAAEKNPPDNLGVQFGGAVGSRAVVAPHGFEISKLLATEMGMVDASPWHTDRSKLYEIAHWISRLSNGLTKMASDIILLSRSEIAELSIGSGGGSSTMPHKSNPVAAEAILTLNRLVQIACAGLAQPHTEDRDGAAWAAEWALIPQMVISTGAALRHAASLLHGLTVNTEKMRATISAQPSVMAEQVTMALAQDIGREKAQELVKAALARALPFDVALRDVVPPSFDLPAALLPEAAIAPSIEVMRSILGRPG